MTCVGRMIHPGRTIFFFFQLPVIDLLRFFHISLCVCDYNVYGQSDFFSLFFLVCFHSSL